MDGTTTDSGAGAARDDTRQGQASPEDQFTACARLAGLTVGDDAGPRMPAVRLTPDNLASMARLLGQCMHRVDLFEQNGRLWFVDYTGAKREMTALKFSTWINNHVLLYQKRTTDGDEPIPCTMAVEHAARVLVCDDFLRGVRKLTGFSTVRLPVVRPGGALERLPFGYDEDTGIFTVDEGWDYDTDMALEAARGWFARTFGGFPITDGRSMAVQVAATAAPMCRMLPGCGGLRMGFLWLANGPETGKSVCAKAAQYPVFGRCPAVKLKKEENLDKELEALLIAQVPSIFLDNIRYGIDSPSIEQMMTAEESEGRAMGGHGLFTARNSALLFVTGNQLKLNADIERRFLVVDMFEKGDPMDRCIPADEILCDDVMKTREWRVRMLGALWAMVREWHAAGMPAGGVIRGSFENFSRTLGGIVEHAGYENPFTRAEIPDAINPDTMEFRELLGLIVAEMQDKRVMDFTLEDMARLARSANLFERMIGTKEEGKAITAKLERLAKDELLLVEDRGHMTDRQRKIFGWFVKTQAGKQPKWNGKEVEFGKREQARKSTYTVTIMQ